MLSGGGCPGGRAPQEKHEWGAATSQSAMASSCELHMLRTTRPFCPRRNIKEAAILEKKAHALVFIAFLTLGCHDVQVQRPAKHYHL